MILHEGLLVVLLVGEVEEQAHLQGGFVALLGLPPGIVVLAEGVVAAGLEHMIILFVGVLPEKFVVDLDGLAVLSHVEVAVGQPHAVLDLDVDTALILEEGDGADPIPGGKVVLEGGHFLLRQLVVVGVPICGGLDFGFRYGGSWPVHLNKYLNQMQLTSSINQPAPLPHFTACLPTEPHILLEPVPFSKSVGWIQMCVE